MKRKPVKKYHNTRHLLKQYRKVSYAIQISESDMNVRMEMEHGTRLSTLEVNAELAGVDLSGSKLEGYQDVFHRYFEQRAESIQIIYRRQTLSLLPFVDRLRLLETKVCLQVADTHPTLGAKTDDVLSSRDRINNRKLLHVHGNRLHLKSLPKRESSRILEEAQKSKSKRNFVKKLSHKEAQS